MRLRCLQNYFKTPQESVRNSGDSEEGWKIEKRELWGAVQNPAEQYVGIIPLSWFDYPFFLQTSEHLELLCQQIQHKDRYSQRSRDIATFIFVDGWRQAEVQASFPSSCPFVWSSTDFFFLTLLPWLVNHSVPLTTASKAPGCVAVLYCIMRWCRMDHYMPACYKSSTIATGKPLHFFLVMVLYSHAFLFCLLLPPTPSQNPFYSYRTTIYKGGRKVKVALSTLWCHSRRSPCRFHSHTE